MDNMVAEAVFRHEIIPEAQCDSRALASHQDGLSSHLYSCKAVGGLATVYTVGTPQTPEATFQEGGWIEQVTRMASVLAALARISNPHRRIHTAATFRSVDGLIG